MMMTLKRREQRFGNDIPKIIEIQISEELALEDLVSYSQEGHIFNSQYKQPPFLFHKNDEGNNACTTLLFLRTK
jgi:hypothetical protein